MRGPADALVELSKVGYEAEPYSVRLRDEEAGGAPLRGLRDWREDALVKVVLELLFGLFLKSQGRAAWYGEVDGCGAFLHHDGHRATHLHRLWVQLV